MNRPSNLRIALLTMGAVLVCISSAFALPASPVPPHATPTPAPVSPSLGVYRLCPDSGPLKGGTSIAVILDSFGLKGSYQVAGVKLASQQVTSFQPHSFNFSDRLEFHRLSIALPPLEQANEAGKPLPLVVSLSNAKGTIASQPSPFTYQTGWLPPGKPSVGGFSSAVVGPPSGGELTTISGYNFTGDPACMAVNFESVATGVDQLILGQWITATDPGDPLYPANNIVDVTVTTPGGTSDVTFADVFTYVAPMDVVSVNPTTPIDRDPRDGDQLLTDANGFFFNPNWGANWHSAAPAVGVDPLDYMLAGTDMTISFQLGTATQVSGQDHSDECDFAHNSNQWWNPVPSICDYTPQHMNYLPVTYTGTLYWEGFSGNPNTNPSNIPFVPVAAGDVTDDYDYNFSLDTGGLGLTDHNQDFPPGAAYAAIHTEFDCREIDGYFSTSDSAWWQNFQTAAQSGDPSVNGDPTPNSFDSAFGNRAVVIGLLSLDCCHACKAELHPIYAMAVEEPNSTAKNDIWAVMARNWGDQGACGTAQWPIYDPSGRQADLRIVIPWWSGANSVAVTASGKGDNLADQPTFQPVFRPGYFDNGVVVTVPLKDTRTIPNPDNGRSDTGPNHLPVWVGEVSLTWQGSGLKSSPRRITHRMRKALKPPPNLRQPTKFRNEELKFAAKVLPRLTLEDFKNLSAEMPQPNPHPKAAQALNGRVLPMSSAIPSTRKLRVTSVADPARAARDTFITQLLRKRFPAKAAGPGKPGSSTTTRAPH